MQQARKENAQIGSINAERVWALFTSPTPPKLGKVFEDRKFCTPFLRSLDPKGAQYLLGVNPLPQYLYRNQDNVQRILRQRRKRERSVCLKCSNFRRRVRKMPLKLILNAPLHRIEQRYKLRKVHYCQRTFAYNQFHNIQARFELLLTEILLFWSHFDDFIQQILAGCKPKKNKRSSYTVVEHNVEKKDE